MPDPIFRDVLEAAVSGRYSIGQFDDHNFIIGREGTFVEPVKSMFQIEVVVSGISIDEPNKKITWMSNQLFVCFDDTHISVGSIGFSQPKIALADPNSIKKLSEAIEALFAEIQPLNSNGS